jgi:hypothetical protein
MLGSAPDDERVILSKHVEEEKDGGMKKLFVRIMHLVGSSTPCVLIYHTVKTSDTTRVSVRLRGIISKNTVIYFPVFKFKPPKKTNCPSS